MRLHDARRIEVSSRLSKFYSSEIVSSLLSCLNTIVWLPRAADVVAANSTVDVTSTTTERLLLYSCIGEVQCNSCSNILFLMSNLQGIPCKTHFFCFAINHCAVRRPIHHTFVAALYSPPPITVAMELFL